MMVPIRFALVGKSGAGKSTAGQHLGRLTGVEHVRTGVISRQIARLLFGNEDKRSTQKLDNVLTTLDPSIFVRAALRPYGAGAGFILDSLRFSEDVALARELGCRVVRIVAPSELRHDRLRERGQLFDPATDDIHRSETELDAIDVDHEVENAGDVSSLVTALAAMIAKG